jgi:hypothetical protein
MPVAVGVDVLAQFDANGRGSEELRLAGSLWRIW